jgi:histidyl-tRNA synthetase
LVELYGGPPTPATGFALGVERTYLALKNLGLTENLLNDVKVMIISLVNDYVYVDKVATSLRNLNYITNVRFVSKGRLGDLLGVASRKGYRYVVVIGEKEVSTGKVSVKDLLNRRQEDVEVDNIVKYFGGS